VFVLKKRVAIVGGIPNPIGGVSTYVLRCIRCFGKEFYSEVLDPYPLDKKFFESVMKKGVNLRNQ